MNLDLSNPDHEAALRSALGLATHPAMADDPTYCATMAAMTNPPVKWAFEALSSPTSAAELIRQLVERAGVKIEAMGPRDLYLAIYVVDGDDFVTAQWSDNDCIASHYIELVAHKAISSLLALAPDAGAEAVLRALRGESKPYPKHATRKRP